MLVRPHQLFSKALGESFALGAFNTSNLELSQAIIWAGLAQDSPVIVQTSESAIEYAGLKIISTMVRQLAEAVSVPVVLHLDHGQSEKIARACIDSGYTSVMIDAAKLPFEENIALVKKVVRYAHDRGVWVEAELGAILGQEGARGLNGGLTPEDMFTKPEQAEHFIEATGADALAVSVGTIHGAFTGQEYIRFELLEQIQQCIPHTPLVLHGASGIADDHIERAVKTNVCKVNVDTELRSAFEEAVKEYLKVTHEKLDPRALLGAGREAVQAAVEHKIKLFGSGSKTKYTSK